MRLDQVDLNLFVVFDALYRERSVTRVAQTLHLTQPAVSNALNRLRKSFDDQLFVRGPRGMQPTPVAEAVSADVQKALVLLQKSMLSGQRFDPSSAQTTFRLGMNDMAQNIVLPNVRNTLAQEAPGIIVEAYYSDRDTAVEQLKSGDLDLLLDTPQVNARELEQLHLGSLAYRVAMARSHPLAAEKLALSHYISASHVHVSARARGRGQVDLALHTMGHRRQVSMRVQHYAVAAAVTAQSDLLWTAPGPVVDHPDLHIVDVPFAVESLVFNLYWHRSAAEDPANAWMREVLRQEFANGVSQGNYYSA